MGRLIDKSPAPALARGLDLIELIVKEGELSFNHIQSIMEINSSSLNRLIKVLLEKGYITKNINNRYVPGLKIFMLNQGKSLWTPLVQRSTDILREISTKFQVTVLLIGLSKEYLTVLNKVAHPDNITMQEVGEDKRDYILSPWGFLFLSQLNEKDRENVVEINRRSNRSGLTPPNDGELARFINMAEKVGYTDDEGTIMKNVRRFAVPVYGMNNEIVSSIAVGSFTSLLDNSKIVELIRDMKQKASELSLLVNY